MNKFQILVRLSLLVTTVWAQYPAEWAVDAHDFEFTMTLTGELFINDQVQTSVSSAVAVFSDGQCRGVVEGTPVGDNVLYFLLIYANDQGDSLQFRAWDAGVGNVVPLDVAITFSSGASLGEVDTPYLLSGTNSVSHIDAFDDALEQPEDSENPDPFDILANDIYDGSLAVMVTFPTEPLHGFLMENIDQTFTYSSDENFFGQDSFQYRLSHEYGSDSAWVQVNITPVDDPPGDFHLLSPADNTLFDESTGNAQNFSWETSEDYDGDPISYSLYIFDGENLDTSYTSTTNSIDVNIEDLTRDTWLSWSVAAHDGWGWTISADTFSINVSSLVDVRPSPMTPKRFQMEQNYPNPFNPNTTIRYGLPDDGLVSITILNIQGHVVRTIATGKQQAGWYEYIWNGLDHDDRPVSTGVYLARMSAGDYSQTIKMLMIK